MARRRGCRRAGRERGRCRTASWSSTPADDGGSGRRSASGSASFSTLRGIGGATTSCTRRRFPTSRCSRPARSGRSAATGSSSTGTRSGHATTGASTGTGLGSGRLGVQRLCLRIPRRSFCFSRLHERRLRELGLRGELTVLRGQYAGPAGRLRSRRRSHRRSSLPAATSRRSACPALVPALAARARAAPGSSRRDLRGWARTRRGAAARRPARSSGRGRGTRLRLAGRRRAMRLAAPPASSLPSRREGYGTGRRRGSRSRDAERRCRGRRQRGRRARRGGCQRRRRPRRCRPPISPRRSFAMVEAGAGLRESTADWFEEHSRDLSLTSSLEIVAATYSGR